MSIQDVLTEAGASKGSLYHYFGSKQALLEAVVERLADRTAAVLAPVASDSSLAALDKLQRFFAALASWKLERRELLVALLRVWYSDDNAVVRQKLRHGIADRIAPVLALIVDRGREEGVFTAAYPDQAGRVIVSLVQDLNDRLADLFITYERERGDLRDVEDTVSAYTEALERILGVQGGSVVLVEMATLRPWFEPERTPRGKST